MIRTITRPERLTVQPPVIVDGNAGATKDVLPSRTGDSREFAYRLIQNVGANQVFYAFDSECSAVSYHGYLVVGEQLAVPVTGRVSCYSAGTWKVATLECVRSL